METKRAYKLQEFIAHSSNVNCLKIGERTSRILVTGGEDCKVNLWAIGKPTALLSLSGLNTPVESVCFDPNELQIGAGAASGTIKIWDVEEAKVVRSFTGHRSNCTSVSFYPFGEFFASGSWDTNLKIWDLRRKQCIHTYKGHTRGINVLRFSPDGRWVVSGGNDNSVKIWDLTAGKLLTDFKFHEGPVQCIDFHPLEFLLATGSADKSVKFWDMETFELIGSSAPEYGKDFFGPASTVRSMIFNADGKSLFCGLHESMKVLSWEPMRCHDVVDVGWSTLADLSVFDGKLLGCSYNQSCVGVWVVDLLKIKPYALQNDNFPSNPSSISAFKGSSNLTATLGRLSVSELSAGGSAPNTPQRSSASKLMSSSPGKTSKGSWRSPATANFQIVGHSDSNYSSTLKEDANIAPLTSSSSSANVDSYPSVQKEVANSTAISRNRSAEMLVNDVSTDKKLYNSSLSRKSSRKKFIASLSKEGRSFSTVILQRDRLKEELESTSDPFEESATPLTPLIHKLKTRMSLDANFRVETVGKISEYSDSSIRIDMGTLTSIDKPGGELPCAQLSRPSELPAEFSSVKLDTGTMLSESNFTKKRDLNTRNVTLMFEHVDERNTVPVEFQRNRRFEVNRVRDSKESLDDKQRSLHVADHGRKRHAPSYEGQQRRYALAVKEESVSATEENLIADMMGQHEEFITSRLSHLSKLKVIFQLWQHNDVRGVLGTIQRMSDLSVCADVIGVLLENPKMISLELCASLLPLVGSLLYSECDRYGEIALEMLRKLVQTFGPVIRSTLDAAPLTGVNLQLEQRLERCSECFIELDRLTDTLPSIIGHGGSIGRSARELRVEILAILDRAP